MLKVFNTLGRTLEEFKPLERGRVRFYHCGPTVYWTQHIGNMRAMVMADLIVRSLEHLGYEVNLVRNYTDVGHLTSDEDEGEDKMDKAAKRESKTPQEIAQHYIDVFEKDITALNTRPADVKPKATEHIQEMIEIVQVLIDKGFAYVTDLAVYFDITKAKDYEKLSGQKLEDKLAGSGKAEVADSGKKNMADFALWFFKAGKHANALQSWSSPFKSGLVTDGEGFPGWHIECSAFAKKYLGDTLDFHMGGVEHISVHHTNEIAQSEAANGVKFVNYWLHNEWLVADNEKLAKSEGNAFSLQEVIDKGYNPLALRYLFLTAHYRSKQNFTWDALDAAQTTLNNLHDRVRDLDETIETVGCEGYEEKFNAALSNDFDIPGTVAVMWDMLKSQCPNSAKKAMLLKFDKVLGLKLDKVKKEELIIPDSVQKLIKEREQARRQNNFTLSDELRAKIGDLGYAIKDTPEGSRVKKLTK